MKFSALHALLVSFLLISLNSCLFVPAKPSLDNKSIPPANELEQIKKSYRKDGSLLSSITLRGDKRHGLSQNYYPNGKIQATIPYHYGKKHGQVIWYFKNGRTYRVTEYAQGKKNGPRKFYYDNGKLRSTQTFIDDMPQADLKEFNAYGKRKKNYAKWQYKIIDKRTTNGYVDVIFSFAKKVNSPLFCHLFHSPEGPMRMPVSIVNERQFLRIPALAGQPVNEQIHIFAQYETALKNTYINEREISIKL